MDILKTLISRTLVFSSFLIGGWACVGPEGETGDITLKFQFEVDGSPLNLNSGTYTSEDGFAYVIEDFKMYVSNVQVAAQGSSYTESDSYHLLAPNEGQSEIALSLTGVPRATYDKVSFGIGVDSVANTKLDAPGDLNPSNQMAWNWNVGYKFLLLEGEFTRADTTVPLVFHIGFNRNYAVQTLTFSEPIDLTKEASAEVVVSVDLSELFKNPNTIDFATYSNLMTQSEVDLIAENWGAGFITLKGITFPE